MRSEAHDRAIWYSDPLSESTFSDDCRHSRFIRASSDRYRCDRYVASQGARLTLEFRNCLFLVSVWRIRQHDRACLIALARGLRPVHFRCSFLRRRVAGTDRAGTTLAPMAPLASCQYGGIFYFDADSILCGQWQESAALAESSANCLLVFTDGDRNAYNSLCAANASSCHSL